MPHDHCDHFIPLVETDISGPATIAHEAKAVTRRASGQRLRTWELENGCQCAIIGTCLTLSELRALARKLSLVFPDTLPVDYQIHGYFVKIAEGSERPSRLLNKLLDRRHGSSIRQIRHMKTPEELESYWKGAMKEGNIPGPFWAISSHPATNKQLADRMFADVHMLSHIVGASNRADIERLINLEANLEKLEKLHIKKMSRYREQLARKNSELEDVKAELSSAKNETPTLCLKSPSDADQMSSESRKRLENSLRLLKEENVFQTKQLSIMRRELENTEVLIQKLQEENEALSSVFGEDQAEKGETTHVDLSGKRVLYVGGKPHALQRLRSLIENWNGEFIHHDGGIEKSLNELGSAVRKADAVVFPTDCISHSAVNKIKQTCKRMMKPYIPLRTSGTGSLAAGVTQNISSPAFFDISGM